jgi:hypothetical protein
MFAGIVVIKFQFQHIETCEMIGVSVVIHPHHLGLLMLPDIFCTGQFGQAGHFVINAFNTNYLMSADEEMTGILHPAQNME